MCLDLQRLGFADALYMGTTGAWNQAAEGAVAYGVGESGETTQVSFSLDSPLDFIEVAISNLNFTLSCSAGSKTAKADSVGTVESRPWRIAMKAEKRAFNVVSYYWEDAVRKLFFAVRRVRNADGVNVGYFKFPSLEVALAVWKLVALTSTEAASQTAAEYR